MPCVGAWVRAMAVRRWLGGREVCGVALKCVANWRRYHALRRPARLLCCFDGASALLPMN
jgi:hypothetical protein